MPSGDDSNPTGAAPVQPTAAEDGPSEPPPAAGPRRSTPNVLKGCILVEALILLLLVAFCATLVGVSFLIQGIRTSPASQAPTVAAMSTQEPAPTETATPALDTPTPVPATPAPAATAAPSPTATLTPTPRGRVIFLPVVIRAPSP